MPALASLSDTPYGVKKRVRRAGRTCLTGRKVIVIPKMHSNRISLSRDDISAGGFVRRILVCGHPGDWVRSLQFNSHHFGGGFVRRKIVCRHSRDWVRSVHLALRRAAVVWDALPYGFLTTGHDSFSGARLRIEIVHKFIGQFILPENWLRFVKSGSTHLGSCCVLTCHLLPGGSVWSIDALPQNPCRDLRWLRLVDFRWCLTALKIPATIFGGFVWSISDAAASPASRAEIFGGFVSLISVGAARPS